MVKYGTLRIKTWENMNKKLTVCYRKTRYLMIDVMAESHQDAIDLANDTDEKCGTIIETPYILDHVGDAPDHVKKLIS